VPRVRSRMPERNRRAGTIAAETAAAFTSPETRINAAPLIPQGPRAQPRHGDVAAQQDRGGTISAVFARSFTFK